MHPTTLSPRACRVLLTAVCLLLLGHALTAQVTVARVKIGGRGALGSEGGTPPVLSNGAVATGRIAYRYNSERGLLRVKVHNTSPVVPGEVTPVITEVYFNLPVFAVTGAELRKQEPPGDDGDDADDGGYRIGRSSYGGGHHDDDDDDDLLWDVKYDFNTLSRRHQIAEDTFGCFSVRLRSPDGTEGGIANQDAKRFPENRDELLIGPVTFVFKLEGPNLDALTANTFASDPSVPCRYDDEVAIAAFAYCTGDDDGNGYGQSGSSGHGQGRIARHKKHDDGCGTIGTLDGCVPGLWYAGGTWPGDKIKLLRAAAPDCHYCLVWSYDPTPTEFMGFTIPIAPPYHVLVAGALESSIDPLRVRLPDRPSLIGETGYFVLVVADPVRGPQFSEVVPITIGR